MSELDTSINILIIDDSPLMRMAMKSILTHLGCKNIQEAEGGEQALAMLDFDQFQLILLDWHMPEMNGLDVLKALKEHESCKDVPVIIVSAEYIESNVQEAKENGAADYIAKPFSPQLLKEKLTALFGTE